MSFTATYTKVDYLFAGAGASATLLMLGMERRGLLQGKTVLVLDPDNKSRNDKTYCFWSDPQELKSMQCADLVAHKWDKVSVNRSEPEFLSPMQYMQIASLDLYQEMHRMAVAHNVHRKNARVVSLKAIEQGVEVTSDEEIYHATTVFDSRPPQYESPKDNEAHLLQTFIGYLIEAETSTHCSEFIDLMDFSIAQQGFTQFMYVLPFGDGKFLVELTRFGLEAITHDEADPILRQYIAQRYGNFQILDTETGCIPMSNAAMKVNAIEGVIPLGGRGGAIKPSTGYAFKNMCKEAEKLAEQMEMSVQPINAAKPLRFRFYDRLLLHILSRHPLQGKPIFEALFQKNEFSNVLRFLDEKTALYEEIPLLFSLPLKPFLSALWYDVLVRTRHLAMPFWVFLFSLVLWGLQSIAPEASSVIPLLIFSLGLLVIGIPHGAVDYLLDSGKLDAPVRPGFVLRYLAAGCAYLVLWLVLPWMALFFFLFFSAWHFGEADMKEWLPLERNPFKKWFWGALSLGVILLGHISETNLVLSNMNAPLLPLTEVNGRAAGAIFALFMLGWGYMERRWAMMLSAAMLLVCINLPLITTFGIYFIGQHSLNGWSHLKLGLNANDKSLFLKALPFTAGAFLLFASMLYCLEVGWLEGMNGHWITAFFVFISCISFPHVVTMNKFYEKEDA